MNNIQSNIEYLRQHWSKPKKAKHDNEEYSFKLKCKFFEGLTRYEIFKTFTEMGIEKLPSDYLEFLINSNGAFLFKDFKYGQAGLHLYSIEEINLKSTFWNKTHRANSLTKGDLIIGEFLGDSDIVILRCDSESSDFESVIISLPIYDRKEWFKASDNFALFFSKFIESEGLKYWEVSDLNYKQ